MKYINSTQVFEDVPLVAFVYLAYLLACQVSVARWFRSLLLCSCHKIFFYIYIKEKSSVACHLWLRPDPPSEGQATNRFTRSVDRVPLLRHGLVTSTRSCHVDTVNWIDTSDLSRSYYCTVLCTPRNFPHRTLCTTARTGDAGVSTVSSHLTG